MFPECNKHEMLQAISSTWQLALLPFRKLKLMGEAVFIESRVSNRAGATVSAVLRITAMRIGVI